MGSLHILQEQVKILHRRSHVAMPEDDRQPHHFPAVAEVLCCESVAVVSSSSSSVALVPSATLTSRKHQRRHHLGSLFHLPPTKQNLAKLNRHGHAAFLATIATHKTTALANTTTLRIADSTAAKILTPPRLIDETQILRARRSRIPDISALCSPLPKSFACRCRLRVSASAKRGRTSTDCSLRIRFY